MEPHPEPEPQVLRGPQPGGSRSPRRGRQRAGCGGGRGGSPPGAGRGGRAAARGHASVLRGSAGWRGPRRIPPSAGGVGAWGARRARQGGARRGGDGGARAGPARVNGASGEGAVGDPGTDAPARVSARPPCPLGLFLESARGLRGHVWRGALLGGLPRASRAPFPASRPRDRGLTRRSPRPRMGASGPSPSGLAGTQPQAKGQGRLGRRLFR